MYGTKHNGVRLFRRAVAVMGILCLLCSFGAVSASAAGGAKLAVGSCAAEKGQTAQISLNMESNPGIWGLKLRISYDSSALTLKSVTGGTVFAEDELTLSESLSALPYIVVACGSKPENTTACGKIVTLNFAVKDTADLKAYPVTVEVIQAIDASGSNVTVETVNGAVNVVKCVHTDKEWRVTKTAECEEAGEEKLICTDCGDAFDTRSIKATGHLHTEIRGASAATKTAEGYTGDTYCKDCGELIAKGKTIAKLEDDTSKEESSEKESSEEESSEEESSEEESSEESSAPEPPVSEEPDISEAVSETASSEEESVILSESDTSSAGKTKNNTATIIIVAVIAVIVIAAAAVLFITWKRRG